MKHINTIRRAMALVAVIFVVTATALAQTVNYIDKDGNEQTCETYEEVEANIPVWNAGWYLVNKTLEISGGVTVTGEVHLILADGASLTVTGAAGKAGVNVSGKDNSLTIYGQAEGTGRLIANGMGYANYDKAAGSGGTGGGAGIGGNDMQSGGNITVNGGNITATGGGGGAGIGGGCDGSAYNIEINRGTVTANGSLLSTGIGMGADNSGPATVNFGTPDLNWSVCNLGATNGTTKESWYGDYYAWGEVEPYYADGHAYDNPCSSWRTMTTGAGNTTITGYDWTTYGDIEWNNKPYESDNKLTTERDVASQVLGGTWRMPTTEEWQNLYKNNTFVWLEAGGEFKDVVPSFTAVAAGYLVIKGKGDGMDTSVYMFLPVAGYRNGTSLSDAGTDALYWSSSLNASSRSYAYYMYFDSDYVLSDYDSGRYFGFSVRPVRNTPNTTVTLTLNDSDNTAAKELVAAWEKDDVVNVYNVNEQVGSLSYRNHDGSKATFTGYINEGIEPDTKLTFRKGTTIFSQQVATFDWAKANYSLEGTATYNNSGTYTMNIGVPYALMKLDLSAFGTAEGTTVTIRTGSPSETVASVTGVTTTSTELYVAMPANGVETEYTFCGNGEVVKKTWTLEANKFYTEDGSSTGGAIVIEPVKPVESNEWINFNDPAMGVSGLPKWAKYNVGVDTTKLKNAYDWYGDYYAWGELIPYATQTWTDAETVATTTWNTDTTLGGGGTVDASKGYAWQSYCNGPSYFAEWSTKPFDETTKVLLPSRDVAHSSLGGTWRMPTGGEWQQLKGNTYFKWTENYNIDGLNGYIVYKVKDVNDKGLITFPYGTYNQYGEEAQVKGDYTTTDPHLFLPAASSRYDGQLVGAGFKAYYSSSSLSTDPSGSAYTLYFNLAGVSVGPNFRYYGQSVRPVRNSPNTIATIALSNGDNTAAKALGTAWKEGDVVNVYNGETNVGELSYRYDEGGKAIFKGYIDNTLAAGITLTFRYGTPSYTGQDGLLATLQANYSLVGTAEYNADGNYNNISMGVPYALMKLDLSALVPTSGSTMVTISTGGSTVASVKEVTATSNELYVMLPTENASDEENPTAMTYTFEGGIKAGVMTWAIKQNTFYTDGGAAIVVEEAVETSEWIDFNDPAMDVTGLPRWAKYNVGATNGATAESWYGDYYAWGATTTWYSADGQTSSPTWKDGYTGGYSWAHCPYTNGEYSYPDNTAVFMKYVPTDKSEYWGGEGSPDNKTVLEACDDIARQHASWGGTWRMPTGGDSGELQQLKDNTYFYWTESYKGVSGLKGYIVYKVKNVNDKGSEASPAPSGESYTTSDPHMFLPTAGFRTGTSFELAGDGGYYCSSSLYVGDPSSAYGMFFDSDIVNPQEFSHRRDGFPVRPVRNTPNTTATLTLNTGDNTAAMALEAAWKEGDVVKVYNEDTNVGELSYHNHDGSTATFTGYINEGIEPDTKLTFRKGTTPSYIEQDGALATLQANYCIEGTATYNAEGNYTISMGTPYALMKLNLSAFGNNDGTTVTISAGGSTVASVTGVKTTSTEVYVAMPANGVETEYTFCGYGEVVKKTWTLEANKFYTGNGGAMVIKPASAPNFKLSETKTIEFAKGNLYWDGSSWKIEANQWDYRTWEGKNSCIGGTVSETGTPTGNCGLFKWGNETEAIDGTDTWPTSGIFFAASDFTVDGETWCTLSYEEWYYLIEERTPKPKKDNFKSLTIGGTDKTVSGLVLLSDNSTADLSSITDTDDLDTNGAVFFPAAGERYVSGGVLKVNEVGEWGYYWSSTDDGGGFSNAMTFNAYGPGVGDCSGWNGRSIRLVRVSNVPNTIATITLGTGDNTAAKALEAAWKEGDTINVYNGKENVGALSYRYDESGNAIFKGYIDNTLAAGTPLTFRFGTTPAFTEQDGALATLKTNYSLVGTATYNAEGNYSDITMGTPYALMKLDLSAFGTTEGTTVTIKAGDPSETVASVTGITTSSKELYVMLPTENASDEENPTSVTYTFESVIKTGVKTWAIKQNTFKDDGAGGAIVVQAEMRTVNFGTPNLDWAVCNLGATNGTTKESWYGDYYAWGETATKADYSWSTYKHCNGSDKTLTKYNTVDNKTVLEADDDAAHAVLGGSWRMPTATEWQDLYDNNTFVWLNADATYNDVVPSFTAVASGYLVIKGKEGEGDGINTSVYMFLPAAGYRFGTSLDGAGSDGHYWSSSLNASDPVSAYSMRFYSNIVFPQYDNYYRSGGFSVRPLQKASIATITLSNGDNTAAKALDAAWKEGDTINVYNGKENVGALSYRYEEGGNAIFKGYINENIEAGTTLTFRKGTPSYTGQDGLLATLKTYYCLEGTATYNTEGNYSDITMGTPYALMKLDLSAFGAEAPGTTVTISAGDPSETVASVTGVKDTSTELYVAMPANGVETEYTFSGNVEVVKKTWTLEANKFYTRDGGSAILIKTVETDEWIDFNDAAMGVNGLPKWAKKNVGATNGTDKESWYGDYYAWGATDTWYSAGGQTSSPTWKDGYSGGYSWANCPYTNGTYSSSNKAVFTKYVPQDQATKYGYDGKYDNKTVLDAADDIARQHASWGGDWRMPTTDEFQQLKDNTYFQWTESYNDVPGLKGYIVYMVKSVNDKGSKASTAPSGKSYTTSDPHMFLPAAGCRGDGSLDGAGSYGYYWSSSLYADYPYCAYYLSFDSGGVGVNDYGSRSYGLSVRPVSAPQN